MTKCKCGNAVGEIRAKPYPVSFTPMGEKQPVFIYYMGGISQHGLCWFCQFPR